MRPAFQMRPEGTADSVSINIIHIRKCESAVLSGRKNSFGIAPDTGVSGWLFKNRDYNRNAGKPFNYQPQAVPRAVPE